VVYAFALLGVVLPNVWWGGVVNLLLACLGCSVIAWVLNRFFPEFVGKKRIKKSAAKS
jgi:uncharacterized membrane protein YdjX (TVP38/TMEM64 family)